MKNITSKERLDRGLFELQSRFCRVLAEPKRLQILWLVREEELTVSDIARKLNISVQNASQHLRIMRDLNAVRIRREGRRIFYRIANPKFADGSKLIRQGILEEYKKLRRPK